MKKIIFLLVIIAFSVGCKKDNVIENAACNKMTTIDSWTTNNFKTNYTIQVPSGFKGLRKKKLCKFEINHEILVVGVIFGVKTLTINLIS